MLVGIRGGSGGPISTSLPLRPGLAFCVRYRRGGEGGPGGVPCVCLGVASFSIPSRWCGELGDAVTLSRTMAIFVLGP